MAAVKPSKDFVDWIIPRVVSHPANRNQDRESIVNQLLYSSEGMKKMSSWWEQELTLQKHQGDCPPSCTEFESHLIDNVNPKYTRKGVQR